MPFTMNQVKAVLSPEEPSLQEVASLDESALPSLESLIAGEDRSLAVKAAFALRHIGPRASSLIQRLAKSSDPLMRVAAASSVPGLNKSDKEFVLDQLLDDKDLGVLKITLRNIPPQISPALFSKVRSLSANIQDPLLRRLSIEAVERIQPQP